QQHLVNQRRRLLGDYLYRGGRVPQPVVKASLTNRRAVMGFVPHRVVPAHDKAQTQSSTLWIAEKRNTHFQLITGKIDHLERSSVKGGEGLDACFVGRLGRGQETASSEERAQTKEPCRP